MELSAPKAAIVLALIAALTGAGAYGYAGVRMRESFSDLRGAIGAIGYARGGALPADDDVRAQIESLAAERAITLDGLSVASHEERGLGVAATIVGAPLTGSLAGTMRIYDVRAAARTQALFFSREEPIEVRVSLRASVRLAPPAGAARGIDAASLGEAAPDERGARGL